jgi:putative membrane protein
MEILIKILIIIIAILHAYFLLLEMYFWDKPLGLKVFRMNLEKANVTKALALNQGLYNGFLVAGLIWSLIESNKIFAHQLQLFFLACVLIAGIVGGLSVNRRIFMIQGLPALLTIILNFI